MKRKVANIYNKRWVMKYTFPVSQLTCVLLLQCFCGAVITSAVYACSWFGTDHSVRFNTYRVAKEFGRLPPYSADVNATTNSLFSWDEENSYCQSPENNFNSNTKTDESLWSEADTAIQEGNLTLAREKLRKFLNESWSMQERRNSAYDKLDALTALDKGSPDANVQLYLNARSQYDSTNSETVIRSANQPQYNQPSQPLLKSQSILHLLTSKVGILGEAKQSSSQPKDSEKAESNDQTIRDSLRSLYADKNLRDNATYLEAAILLRKNAVEGIEAFAKVAANYPQSEKREAALFTYALAAMKQSKSFTYNNGDDESSKLCSDCQDEYWHKALAGFERLLHEYPKGRYYTDAQGWIAHLWLRGGDRANALAEYYRMLASKEEAARMEAVYSLRLVRDDANADEMRRVENLIQNEPDTALAYAYHNLYNYASIRLHDRHLMGSFSPKEKRSNREEVERIVSFSNGMLRRFSQKSVSGEFLVRLAEANLELEKYTEAAKYARRALNLGVKNELRAEALWAAGFAEFRLKEYRTAKEALTKLVEENQNNRFTEGARRNLAMLLEDAGDLDGALEQYLALDYRHDIAYFIDVLLKPEQLANFIEKHPHIKQPNELLYALGIRYLRDFRWGEARKTFLSIPTSGRDVDWQLRRMEEENTYPKPSKPDPLKLMSFDECLREIRPQWIDQDLNTITNLERLEKEYKSAVGDEAKSEALYQFASYIFQGDLLFYNQFEWSSSRALLLGDLYSSGQFRQPGESQLLIESMQKHDMASRALEIYLDVVKKYPNTKAARDALYTAAVCHQRLHEYNNYWRDIYADGGHAGERMVTYADVKRTYPDYKFPLGTFGWEPMTRTVNGGPGWAVPPKPKPRPPQPTFRQRAFAKLKGVTKSTLKMMRKSLRRSMKMTMRFWRYTWAYCLAFLHCLWVGFSFSTLCVVFRQSQQARRRFREELSRCAPMKEEPSDAIAEDGKQRQIISSPSETKEVLAFALKYGLIRPYAVEPDLPSLSLTGEPGLFKARFGNFLRDDLRDKWLAQLREFFFKANQLRDDANGRSALILTIATHSLCFFLLVNLLLSL